MVGSYLYNQVPPQGSLIMLNLLSTYGDSNYIGLNGFQVYDHNSSPILPAIPHSI
jgi:hypothetical protein